MFNRAYVLPRRQFKFLLDCTGLNVHLGCIFLKNFALKNSVLPHVIFVLHPLHEAKCRGLGVVFTSIKKLPSDRQSEIQSYVLPREMPCRESKKGKSAREIGPSERFIGSNEDVGGVQVDVLWLRPVSIMDLASQLAIDCTAHDLVFLLFFPLPVCQPATKRWRTKKNLLPDDRYSVQKLSHYLKGGLR